MEVKKTSATEIAIKWGAIYVITSIVITYIIQFLNLDPDSSIKWFAMLPFVAFMFLAQKEFKDNNGGYITFGEGFKVGFLFAILSGVVLAIFTYLYYSVLSPQMLEKLLSSAEAKLAEKGTLSQEQIDQAMGFTRKLLNPVGMAIIAVIFSAISGVVVSLIGAAIVKKERSAFDVPDYADQKPTDPTV